MDTAHRCTVVFTGWMDTVIDGWTYAELLIVLSVCVDEEGGAL